MIVKRGEVWLADLNPTRGSDKLGRGLCSFFNPPALPEVDEWTTLTVDPVL